MEWFKYYRIFNKLKEELETNFKHQEKVLVYYNDNQTDSYYQTVEYIKEKVNGYLEEYKLQYTQNNKIVKNSFELIESELRKITSHFEKGTFNIKVNKDNIEIVDEEDVKSSGVFLYYKLDELYDDLEIRRIKGNSRECIVLCLLWAYVRYWFWLHEQHPAFPHILSARSLGLQIKEPIEESIIDLILSKYTRPYKAFQEISLFLESVDNSSLLKSLEFYIKDKVYSLYLLEKIKGNNLNRTHKNSSKAALQAFYYDFMDLMNESYNLSKEQQVNPNNKLKLIWNGNKNTLIDIFYQLRNMPSMKGSNNFPLLDNTYEEIAIFLKENFDIFRDTKIKTIEDVLTKESQKPKKPNSKITLKKGFDLD